MTKTRIQELQRRKRKRRQVLDGFPWQGKFQTKEEIDAYFAGDKVQCLLCGKWYKQVSIHLKVHNMTADEYKERFGLPWSRGLTSALSFSRHQKATKDRMEQGFVPSFCDNDFREHVTFPRPPQRGDQPFARAMKGKRALQVHGQSRKWEIQDYEAILERMQKQQRTLGDVCKDKDLPSIVCWNRFIKNHPELHKKAQAIHNTLPYAIQTKTRIFPMSPQFREDCRVLHKQEGLTYGQIGKRLCVSPTTVRYGLIGGKPKNNKKST